MKQTTANLSGRGSRRTTTCLTGKGGSQTATCLSGKASAQLATPALSGPVLAIHREDASMNFHQGDLVVHKKFGVGTVASIENKVLFGGDPRPYYRVDYLRTSIWVPVEEMPAGGLRPITPRDHLERYRSLLKSSPVSIDGDFHQRRSELEKRMQSGTFKGSCEVIRDLNGLRAEKPLNAFEKTLFQQTLEALISEWSMAGGISRSDAIQEIELCLGTESGLRL